MASCRVTLQDDELPRGGDVIHRFRVVLGARDMIPGGASNISCPGTGLLTACASRDATTNRLTRANQEGAQTTVMLDMDDGVRR